MSSKISADISYVNADVEIVLEYDSKNREFYFTVPLADAHTTIVIKSLSDACALLDVPVLHPLKLPSDSFTVSDTAAKVLAKYIADGFALDDGALIDKDYTGTKGNVATMVDILGLSYEHPVADSYSMNDIVQLAWGYARHFNDSIGLSDIENNPLGTIILNTRRFNTANSQFALYRGNDQVDTFGISDIPVLTPGKNFTDTVPFSDIDSYSLDKGMSDPIGCTDTFYIDLATYTDSLSLSDALINQFSKESSDTASISDIINVVTYTGGVMNAIPLNRVRLN